MDRSADNRRVARLVVALAEREDLNSYVAIQKKKGIDRTTLARWRDGKGRRTDWFKGAEEAFDLEPGTLHRIREGQLGVEEVLANWDRAHDRDPGSVSFRSGDPGNDASSQLVDQHAEDRAAHEAELEKLVQSQIRKLGYRPQLPGPGEPPFDLAVFQDGEPTMIIECKTVGAASREGLSKRVWEALGVLGLYAEDLGNDVVRILAMEREPTAEELDLAEQRGVRVTWPDDWSGLGLDQENDQPAG